MRCSPTSRKHTSKMIFFLFSPFGPKFISFHVGFWSNLIILIFSDFTFILLNDHEKHFLPIFAFLKDPDFWLKRYGFNDFYLGHSHRFQALHCHLFTCDIGADFLQSWLLSTNSLFILFHYPS